MKVGAAPRLIAAVLLCISPSVVKADAAGTHSPASLLAKYAALQGQLRHNQFQRPLYLDSSETQDAVRGGIYALVDYRFTTFGAALNSPGNWCDILILHINTKNCRASNVGNRDVLDVIIGKKFDKPPDEAFRVAFAYRVVDETPTYLQVTLNADAGPLSTHDYRIVLEAVALENGQTFVHLAYSFAYGIVARLAMQTYLGSIGRDKVGFSVAGTRPDGQPRHIGGMRGVVERNTMRYYLAIEAFLGALSQPRQAQREKRLHDWFEATERYPRQLHEMDSGAYLDMKRKQ